MVEAYRVQHRKDVKNKTHEYQDRRLFTHKVMEDLIFYNVKIYLYSCIIVCDIKKTYITTME